jgi:hypothetical protein
MEHDYPHLNTLSPLDNARKITSWLLLHATVTLTVVLVASKKRQRLCHGPWGVAPYNLVQYLDAMFWSQKSFGLRCA